MSEPLMRRRSLPDSLRYLARKLDQPLTDGERAGVALTLNELADGLDPQASSAEPEPVDDGLCHATLQGWPREIVDYCGREAGHYDVTQEPDFSGDEPQPGGWHQTAPDEDGNRVTWADWAKGATPHVPPVRPGEETT